MGKNRACAGPIGSSRGAVGVTVTVMSAGAWPLQVVQRQAPVGVGQLPPEVQTEGSNRCRYLLQLAAPSPLVRDILV